MESLDPLVEALSSFEGVYITHWADTIPTSKAIYLQVGNCQMVEVFYIAPPVKNRSRVKKSIYCPAIRYSAFSLDEFMIRISNFLRSDQKRSI
jgi:hypothetical protein